MAFDEPMEGENTIGREASQEATVIVCNEGLKRMSQQGCEMMDARKPQKEWSGIRCSVWNMHSGMTFGTQLLATAEHEG